MAKRRVVEKVGGISFYLSLICLMLISAVNLIAWYTMILDTGVGNLIWLAAFIIVGMWAATVVIRGRLSIFLHELKHAIPSNLVGNKFHALKVGKVDGSFEFKYSKDTAHFNAVIALSPYFFPLFTTLAFVPILFLHPVEASYLTMILGTGVGIDLTMNFRDLSSHQSDISNIRGGPLVAYTYVISANLVIISLVLAWSTAGASGLDFLARYWWTLLSTTITRQPANWLTEF